MRVIRKLPFLAEVCRNTLLLLILIPGLVHSAWAYSELVVFGDSLSDTGNLASLAPVNFPWPYYQNRVSNGPLAVDVLAAERELSAAASMHLVSGSGGGNFAVDGASAAGNGAEDLAAQLQAHLLRQEGQALPTALYVVMIGGNDVRDARNKASASEAEAIVDEAVAAISQTLSTLLQEGAAKILVVNAPDIGRIPETLEKAKSDPAIVARSTQLTGRFNSALGSVIASLKMQHGVALVEFDLFSYFNQLLDNAANHGFTNSEEGCFDSDEWPFLFHPDCDFGARFDYFVFFDSIHPTAKTHSLIGEALHQALQEPAADATVIMPILWYLLRSNKRFE
ncbi:MAG: SGNH/GDSL hydrolase family protein [Pseudomonadota bacterium]|nr:SGNH/GDSL hydrolase family protein [Pseudomonadota bacterium]